MKLYKFKSGSDRDINDLLQDRLWVSTLARMNDPTDLGFYVDGKYYEKDIIAFQDALNLSVMVASFANVIQNRRLWNYYSNGMEGLVLTYRSEDLLRAFARFGDPYGTRIVTGKVSYGSNKYNLTKEFEEFKTNRVIPELGRDLKLLFHKDESWEDEKEYRIAVTVGGKNTITGFHLEKIRPYEVGVGYRIQVENYSTIKEWCKDNKITMRKYIPDFKDKKSGSPFKSEVVVRDGIEKQEAAAVGNEETGLDLPEINEEEFLKLLSDVEEDGEAYE